MTGRYPAGSVGAVLFDAARKLSDQGIDSARLDARVLLSRVLGRDQGWIAGHPEDVLSTEERTAYDDLVSRRARHVPVAHLTGEREFWSLPFLVSPETLIPRPETETLVALGLEALDAAGGEPRILDLGAGSGCILLALLSERKAASGIGLDRSRDALDMAAKNAERLGLDDRCRFVAGDWLENFEAHGIGGFDLIVSNPPYIPDGDILGLAPDVRDYEPRSALAGGADGLDCYRRIVSGLDRALAPGGVFIGEFGIGQYPAIAELFRSAGFDQVTAREDATGRARCVVAGASN